MIYATSSNNSSTVLDLVPRYVQERPISFLATAALTCGGQWIAHKGVFTLLTHDLAIALGIIFASIAVIQWVGMGRYDACRRAGAHRRAREVAQQAIGEGGVAFLCRSTGFEEVEALEAALEEAYAATAGRIDAALCTGEDR